ncbi:MAG: DUF481 domain-containing protein, partial [Fidelibacterota bacterium]
SEISYVNYVRDRQEADIHILITQQGTGGVGQEYTLSFLGQNIFSSQNDTLVFVSDETDTEDMIRQEMVRVIKLGLVPYLSKTSLARNLTVSYRAPEEATSSAVEDRWRNWVFSIRVRSFARGQETTNSISLGGSLSARRVTDEWKINVSTSGNYDEDNFDFNGTAYTSISRSNSFNASVIRSLTDHWSTGLWATVYSSTYSNIDYSLTFVPGVEYNYYPYSESTRRQLRFGYKVGPQYRDYTEQTIYFKLNEQLMEESFSATLDVVLPWGSISASLSGSHYFHDFEKNRVQLSGSLSLKLFKGLSVNVYANVSRIHSQLSLPSGGAQLEEVLLRRRVLETQYNYWASVGLSYSFGSIYSHVVNPRFGGTGGRMIYF